MSKTGYILIIAFITAIIPPFIATLPQSMSRRGVDVPLEQLVSTPSRTDQQSFRGSNETVPFTSFSDSAGTVNSLQPPAVNPYFTASSAYHPAPNLQHSTGTTAVQHRVMYPHSNLRSQAVSAGSRPFEEFFRFNINPAWIRSHWDFVYAGPQFGTLHGYRVALVTGGENSDLTGAMTYYFNKRDNIGSLGNTDNPTRLERIVFEGSTNDCRRLIQMVQRRFGMTVQKSPEPSIIVYKSARSLQKKKLDYLEIRTPNVFNKDHQYEVYLALNRE